MAKAALHFYTVMLKLLPYSIMLLVCCLTACKNKKPLPFNDSETPAQHVSDSLKLAQAIDSADYNILFKNKTNIWLYKMLMNKQNKWANFKLVDFWHKDSLTRYDYQRDTDFYEAYAMFLKWSPDSTYILDHGSYGVEMGKDKKGKYYVKSNDFEKEIDLINNKTKTTGRLLFFGPSTSALSAHWLDSTQVALLGVDNSENSKHSDTLLWIYNIKDKLFRKYKYQPQGEINKD
jgi:hypothetical protein